MLSVKRDIKPQTMTFAKVDRRGEAFNREGAFIQINTVCGIYTQSNISFTT